MAVAYVAGQSGNSSNTSGTGQSSLSLTLPAAVSTGSCVCIYAGGATDPSPFNWTVADNVSGNTYTIEAGQYDGVFYGQAIFIGLNIKNSPTVYTATYNGNSPTFPVLFVDVFTGVATAGAAGTPVSNFQTNPGTGADAINAGTLTPSASGDLIWGACSATSGDGTVSHGTGFTQAQSDSFTGFTEYILSGGASVPVTFTDASHGGGQNYLSFGIPLTPASSGAACVPTRAMLGVGCSLLGADAIERNEVQTRRRMMTGRWRSGWRSSSRN